MYAVIPSTAIIAGCHNHDQSSLPGCFHCLAEWILSVTFKYWPSQRKVHDTNAICIFEGNRALQCGDDIGILPPSIHIQNF